MTKKNKNGVIYCLTSPSGRKYVGQRWNFEQRQYYYKNPKTCKKQRHLYKESTFNFNDVSNFYLLNTVYNKLIVY